MVARITRGSVTTAHINQNANQKKEYKMTAKTNDLVAINADTIPMKVLRKVEGDIQKKHKKVSDTPTPKAFIKKQQDFDYVEFGYMRDIIQKNFPTYSFTIQAFEILGDAACLVHGRFRWFDEGLWREHDCMAAHRIQKKRTDGAYVNIGNDIKAAVTDCWKKGANMAFNVADDVYKNIIEDMELTDKNVDDLLEAARAISEDKADEVASKITAGLVHKGNLDGSLDKLRRLAK
jgi:hypothetical protein